MSAAFEGGDLAAVEQEPERPEIPLLPAVVVSVDGPVQVQPMPTVTGAPRTWGATDAAAKVLGKDPRRASVLLLSVDVPFFFGFTQADADASTAAQWPELVPLALHTREELWLRSATPGTIANVSVVPENWAS